MNLIDAMIESYQFNRSRTLATLDRAEKLDDSAEALAWSPAGRAHVAWQIMHIGITEDIFASERLAPQKTGVFVDLWDRYRGGSTPDDQVPSFEEIRNVLDQSRSALVATLGELTEADLSTIPEPLQERGWTIQTVLQIISWHESHHQGQAHIILNMFENR